MYDLLISDRNWKDLSIKAWRRLYAVFFYTLNISLMEMDWKAYAMLAGFVVVATSIGIVLNWGFFSSEKWTPLRPTTTQATSRPAWVWHLVECDYNEPGNPKHMYLAGIVSKEVWEEIIIQNTMVTESTSNKVGNVWDMIIEKQYCVLKDI